MSGSSTAATREREDGVTQKRSELNPPHAVVMRRQQRQRHWWRRRPAHARVHAQLVRGGAARETGGACAQLSMGCKGAQVRYGRARTLSTMMPRRKSPKATLIMPPEPSRVVTGPAARRGSRRWSRGEPAASKSTQRDKHGQQARALSRVLGASMAVPGDVRVHTSVHHPRRKMHRLTRHTFGACSQRWVCSGSHTDVHEASQAASWASGDDGIARAQMCPQCTHATDDPPRQSGGDKRHRQPTEPTDENDLICRLPASYPEASTQTHPTQMGLFACLLSAPKINLICPVSARICADPLHCRPSIESARVSFKEVRTPPSPNPLLLTLNVNGRYCKSIPG